MIKNLIVKMHDYVQINENVSINQNENIWKTYGNTREDRIYLVKKLYRVGQT